MRRSILLGALGMLGMLVACGSPAAVPAPEASSSTPEISAPSASSPASAVPGDVVVVAAGTSPTPIGRSVGALIRNGSSRDAVEVTLSLEFLDGGGRVVASASERLAYCPANADCLWGSSFTADTVPAEASAVRATASAASLQPASRRAPFVVARRRADGAIAGTAPPEGTVYVVSIVEGVPRAGAFRRTTADPSFVVPADLVPPHAGEIVRAVFYAEPAPLGD